MRLAQISRKINIKPTEVLSYIEQEFKQKLAPSAATEIPEEYIEKILTHFISNERLKTEPMPLEGTIAETPAPSVANEEQKTPTEETPEIESEPVTVIENNEETSIEEESTETQPEVGEEYPVEEEEVNLNIEGGVIRVPKVSVEGIKVVGKMELAKPKEEIEGEEEVLEADEDTAHEDTPQKVEEPTRQQKPATSHVQKSNTQRPKKKKRKSGKHLSFEDQRKKEQENLKNELKKKSASQKRRKRKYYEESIKKTNSSPAKKSRKKQSKAATAMQNKVEAQPRPTSIWGKFIYWLNN